MIKPGEMLPLDQLYHGGDDLVVVMGDNGLLERGDQVV